jgi:hypothetical protein
MNTLVLSVNTTQSGTNSTGNPISIVASSFMPIFVLVGIVGLLFCVLKIVGLE